MCFDMEDFFIYMCAFLACVLFVYDFFMEVDIVLHDVVVLGLSFGLSWGLGLF